MAIQFRCSGCGQAIEVDDEYANRPIACPFCHSTVVAPPTSQLQGLDQASFPAPTDAGGVAAPANAAAGLSASLALSAEPPGPVWLCTLGLVCGLCVIALMVVFMAIMISDPMVRSAVRNQPTQRAAQEELQKAMQDWVKARPGTNAAISILAIVLLVAGLVGSIIGLMRARRRRGQAIAGLIVSGLLSGCMCLGTIMQAATAAR